MVPPPPPAAPAGALKVAALGNLEVELAGRSALAAMGSARTRELLVFLLLHPAGATKEEVGLALWPEASASQIRNSFHVTLHRLRGVLGHPEAIEVAAGRYALAKNFVAAFDVPQFEAGAKASLAVGQGREGRDGSPARGARALPRRAAARRAGGRVAPRETRPAAAPLSRAAGDRRQKAARRRPEAEAAEVYRRWIAADDLAEVAYRGLMESLEAGGEAAEALKVYRKLAGVLQKELGVAPEPASRAIHDRLLKQ